MRWCSCATCRGVKSTDVDVKFEKGELTLHGKVEPAARPDYLAAPEYGIGDFYRTFAIAPEIDTDKIVAGYRDGVLTVHLPRREKLKAKRIAVKAG